MIYQGLILLALLTADGRPLESPPVEAPANSTSSDEVGAFLDRLEKAEQGITTLQTTIRYETLQGLLGDRQVRKGQAYLCIDRETSTKKFRVEFDTYQTSRGQENERRVYIFDGRYLVERLEKEREFIKREVAGEGESADPLSIDGPFPLPIGQTRASIERRFEPQLRGVEDADEGALARLAGFDRLRLTSRSSDDDLEQVDLWYHPDTLIPGRAEIIERGGDRIIVDLARDAMLNPPLDAQLFSSESPRLEDGWRIDIRRLEQPKPSDGE